MPLNRHSLTPDSAGVPRLRGEALCAGYNGRQVLAGPVCVPVKRALVEVGAVKPSVATV